VVKEQPAPGHLRVVRPATVRAETSFSAGDPVHALRQHRHGRDRLLYPPRSSRNPNLLAAKNRIEWVPPFEVIKRQPKSIILTALARTGEMGTHLYLSGLRLNLCDEDFHPPSRIFEKLCNSDPSILL